MKYSKNRRPAGRLRIVRRMRSPVRTAGVEFGQAWTGCSRRVSWWKGWCPHIRHDMLKFSLGPSKRVGYGSLDRPPASPSTKASSGITSLLVLRVCLSLSHPMSSDFIPTHRSTRESLVRKTVVLVVSLEKSQSRLRNEFPLAKVRMRRGRSPDATPTIELSVGGASDERRAMFNVRSHFSRLA
jgi:hypothetical protein